MVSPWPLFQSDDCIYPVFLMVGCVNIKINTLKMFVE